MTGFDLAGRVPLWVQREGVAGGPAVVVLHDLGADPAAGAAVAAARPAWDVFVLHQRGHGRSGTVRGGTYTVADLAADATRVLDAAPEPVAVLGIGRGALVAAVAAAARPTGVRCVALAPGDADIACEVDPSAARRRWFAAVTGGVEPTPALPFAEPLYPDDRELLWRSVPRPVGWVGMPTGAWTEGAPADVLVAAGADLISDAADLLDELLSRS